MLTDIGVAVGGEWEAKGGNTVNKSGFQSGCRAQGWILSIK